MPIAVHLIHPEEEKLLKRGEKLFFYRAGSHDYACASCHSNSGFRIRLQTLPNLLDPQELKSSMATWPAYRLSQGYTRTLRWRIFDCMRQQHLPPVNYESDVLTALELYLMQGANGALLDEPAVKR